MKILIVGICSTRGPDSWPYFLAEMLGVEIVNLSIAGGGNAFAYETVINELAHRRHWYDLVIVVWAESHHTSIKVDNINYFQNTINTSKYQSEQNDWPEKIVEPFNDQDLVPKNWVLGIGSQRGMRDSTDELFVPYHKFVKYPQLLESDLIKIISTQEVLRANNKPYLFLFAGPHKQFKRFKHLYDLIDYTNIYKEDDLISIASRNPDWQHPEFPWPTAPGQKYYAELIANYLIDKKLVV